MIENTMFALIGNITRRRQQNMVGNWKLCSQYVRKLLKLLCLTLRGSTGGFNSTSEIAKRF